MALKMNVLLAVTHSYVYYIGSTFILWYVLCIYKCNHWAAHACNQYDKNIFTLSLYIIFYNFHSLESRLIYLLLLLLLLLLFDGTRLLPSRQCVCV